MVLWLAASLSASAATVTSIDLLLAALAREPPQSIVFTEIRSSALLEGELIVSGMLEYAAPGKLSRIVTEPYEERTDIDGDEVRITRADRPERRFSLRRAPELRGLLTSFSAILGGGRAALEREFELSLATAEAGWQLTLTPRGKRARASVGGIRVRGVDDTPACIAIGGKGGESTALLLGAAAGPDAAAQRTKKCAVLP
jgi:hypothetical protein